LEIGSRKKVSAFLGFFPRFDFFLIYAIML